MHFVFKQAVCLEGKDYARGGHDLSESVLEKLSKSKTFEKYCELGWIEKSETASAVSTQSILEQNKKLAESFSSPKVEAIAPDAETVGETSDSMADKVKSEEQPKEQASSKSKSKKR